MTPPVAELIFLDTNIFLYAGGREHPHRAPCQRVLEKVARRAIVATTNTETLQEILHVLGRRGQRNEALVLIRNALRILPEILPVTAEDVRSACEILEQNAGIRPRDSFHAATMIRNGITQIMSLDPDFDRIPGIRRVAPQ